MRVYIPDHLRDDDDLERAARWVSDELKYNPGQNADELIEESVHRFELSLMEAEVINIMFADISKRQTPTATPWVSLGL
jgi:hypothetical protein